jgi:hypothetical protein
MSTALLARAYARTTVVAGLAALPNMAATKVVSSRLHGSKGGKEAAENAAGQNVEQTPSASGVGQNAGQGIEAVAVHDIDLQSRLRAAVEARRQGGVQSPSSIVGC